MSYAALAQHFPEASARTSRPDSSLSTLSNSNPRKRKRETDKEPISRKRPFILRPCLSPPFDTPHNLVPVTLLPRSQLSLSFLDTVASEPHGITSRLFSGHVGSLEPALDADGKGHRTNTVLIARSEADGSALYAVERVRKGVYASCKLGAWVTASQIQDIAARRGGDGKAVGVPEPTTEPDGQSWWKRVAVTGIPPAKSTKDIRCCPQLSMTRTKRAGVNGHITPPEEAPEHNDVKSDALNGVAAQVSEDHLPEQPPTAQQVFETLVSQYLQALYLSKTSLAYFAKGPLSRARAAFSTGDDSMPVTELATLLRSMLLSSQVLDKKYREKLPDVVKAFPLAMFSDEEQDDAAVSKIAKKRKPKQLKLGRDGLYTCEEEYLKKWWLSEGPVFGGSPHESVQDALRRKATDLRVRETLAQLILALEVLSLESSPSYQIARKEQTSKSDNQLDVSPSTTKKRNQKKAQDLGLLIDLIIDKLCIWQSVEQEESTQHGQNVGGSLNSRGQKLDGKPADADLLKGFCTEVIIPFYIHRAPDKAAVVNRKLGGSNTPSPAKRPSAKTSTSHAKPGEPDSKKETSKQRRKPLQRVSTENNIQPSKRVPSLVRSLTDSRVTELKREVSEVPLSKIPTRSSPSISLCRSGVSQFKHLSQREVDFSALATSKDAASRKKLQVEQQLKDAISTLKKPNRGLAVKELVETSEMRSQLASHRSRKAANPQRKVLQSVQVTATPKRVRKTHPVTAPSPQQHRHLSPGLDDLSNMSLPSEACIPSSTIRPSAATFIVPGSVVRRQHPGNTGLSYDAHPNVHETPSRGSSKFLPIDKGKEKQSFSRERNDMRHASTPSTQKDLPSYRYFCEQTAAVPCTPSRSEKNSLLRSAVRNAVPVTPVRGGSESKPVESSPLNETSRPSGVREAAKADMESSIYDVLGWNDDVDELA